MDLGLSGKTAFVFGASKGMGAAVGRVLAAERADVVLFARSEERLKQTASEIMVSGRQAKWQTIDLTDTANVRRAIDRAISVHGFPDLVLVSAGAAQGGVFWDIGDDLWSDAFALKFMGMVRVLRALSPGMKERRSGRIVVIVGNNGHQPSPRMLPGSAANAACLAVIRGLAEELAPHGVTVSALNPGPTKTDRWAHLIGRLAKQSGRDYEAVEAEQLAKLPKERIGTAEEMAHLAVMMMSDHADMVTGVSLTADGGATKALA